MRGVGVGTRSQLWNTIFFGHTSLRHVITQYLAHYHHAVVDDLSLVLDLDMHPRVCIERRSERIEAFNSLEYHVLRNTRSMLCTSTFHGLVRPEYQAYLGRCTCC